MESRHFLVAIATIVLPLLSACSSTRVLTDGQSRLVATRIEVEGEKVDATSSAAISRRIDQQPGFSIVFGWDPMVNIYNMSSSRGNLLDRFFEKIGTAPIVLDSTKVSSSVKKISEHLIYNGYYSNSVEAKIYTKKKKSTVTYRITTGKRRTIDSIQYILPQEDSLANDLRSNLNILSISEGDFLSEADLDAAAERFTEKMRQDGHYAFNKNHITFEADTLDQRTRLKIIISKTARGETRPNPAALLPYQFGNVSLQYPSSLNLKEDYLKAVNLLVPGQPYSSSTVNDTYSRFSSIGLFSRVDMDLSSPEAGIVDTNIKLTPSKLQGFKFDFEGSINSTGLWGLSPQISYFHKNAFGGAERLQLGYVGNLQFSFDSDAHSTEHGINMSIDFPRFVFVPMRLFRNEIPHTLISASFKYQTRPEYTRNMLTMGISYSGHVGQKKRITYTYSPLQLNIVNLYNIESDFYDSMAGNPFLRNAYQNHFDIGSGADFYYRERHKYMRLQVDIAGNLLSAFKTRMPKDSDGAGMIWNTPFSQYFRSEISGGRTWSFGREDRHAIAFRALAGVGLAYGNSTALPFEKHFWAGGASSLRGFQARSIGPGRSKISQGFVIPNQTGDMHLEVNLEYRFPVVWKIEGAAFADAGNVWTLNSKTSDATLTDFAFDRMLESTALCAGTGMRINLDFLLLRLDLGWPIYHPAGFDSGALWIWKATRGDKIRPALQFGIGYPF